MAGRGPIPKPADRRSNHTTKDGPITTLEFTRAKQPELPKRMPNGDAWPAHTRAWWKMWGRSPLTSSFTEVDWSELLDTATIHGAFWSGELNQAAELRRRVANFGATPSDRARLRIQFAEADAADAKRPDNKTSSRARRGALHALPAAASE